MQYLQEVAMPPAMLRELQIILRHKQLGTLFYHGAEPIRPLGTSVKPS